MTDPTPPRSRRPLLLLAAALSAVALAAGAVYYRWPNSAPPGPEPAEAATPGREDEDARMRRLAVGVWQDDYKGKRTMTLKEDGTGTMVVELSGVQAFLAAPRLRFDMKWSLENGRLKKQTVGGEPAGKVQMILKTMGGRVDEPILELTPTRLLLLDKDGKTKYDWRRSAQ